MDRIYVNKEYWMPKTTLLCLHCEGPISYRPFPIGFTELVTTGGINTCCGFCSPLCARTYADQNYSSDIVERLTTRIMLDFKRSLDPGDDPDLHRFLQSYDRFSQIPRAPARHDFVPYGTLTHEKFRAAWTGTETTNRTETFGSLLDSQKRSTSRTIPLEEGHHVSIQSAASDGPIIDTEQPPTYSFHKVTSYSTKRQYRTPLGQTLWPSIGLWSNPPST